MTDLPQLPPLATELPPEALRVHALARRITTPCGDGDLVWHVWGEDKGEPLVLLHGGSGSWTHWIRNVEALAATGRRVVVPDLPGFGDSARPPGGQDADSVAPAIAAALPALVGDAPVDVVGFSFGGLCGGLMAAAHPERVKRLVIVGAPGLGLRDRRLPLMSWRDAPTEEGKLAAHRNNLGVLMLHPENVDDLALAVQAANVPRDRMHRRRLALTDILARTLPALTCRVDAIYGEEDALYRDVLPALREKIATTPYLGELVLMPGAAHWLQYEQPEAFHRELQRLL
ncbi:alpha/beta hydrolase [Ramlibacter sp. USB13]|uniref:Alpha/beta hydrolase n=1 Tax=Ramlibacter cellulosilyticus TaxID=2764187 RepID=A0A923MR16_9BURK|nr:alpha/beta hydrolase [Ramlibacter cellulosilyticus]MBC5783243.1 alpha/beta hydrolase [Ramlibacter cellulosilyticus]